MKKLILLFSVCAFSFASFAQDDTTMRRQPMKGDRAISFSFSGIAVMGLNLSKDPVSMAQMMDLRYFFKDDLAARLGLGVKIMSTTTITKNDTTGGIPLLETENKIKSSALTLAFGVERHFKTRSKTIDPFMGPGLYFSWLGKNKVENATKTTMSNGNFNETLTNTTSAGGFAVGLMLNTGFFWYFADNIALGGEFSMGYSVGTTGGEINTETTVNNQTGGVLTSTSSSKTTINKVRLSAFQTLNTGSISLLVKF